MLTITSNEQAESLIKNGVLAVYDDIEIAFDGFRIEADIKCRNIYSKDYSRNINAWNINARNINARNITADNIDAWNINARNINARNITADNINARNIDAGNINARNIDAWDINYYAVCFAHNDIICTSIKGSLEKKAKHFCVVGKIIIKDKIKENENVNNNLK